mgnify:CR=1 FL=1
MTRNDAINNYRNIHASMGVYCDEYAKRVRVACAAIAGDYAAIIAACDKVADELADEIRQDAYDEAYQRDIDSGYAAERAACRY